MENNTDIKTAEETLQDFLLFERLLSNVSAQFFNMTFDQIDGAIQQALQKILEFFRVDRCAMLRIFPEKKAWQVTHAALGDNDPAVPVGLDLPTSSYPWASASLAWIVPENHSH